MASLPVPRMTRDGSHSSVGSSSQPQPQAARGRLVKDGSSHDLAAPHIKRMVSSTVPSLGAAGYRSPIGGRMSAGSHQEHQELQECYEDEEQGGDVYAELERLRAQVNYLQRQADTFGKYVLHKHISTLDLQGGQPQPAGAIPAVRPISAAKQTNDVAPSQGGNDAMSLFISSEQRLYEGWCMRRGGQFGKTWKRRYIVLYRDRLDFYDKEDSPQPRFQLPLLRSQCKLVSIPLTAASSSSKKDPKKKETCIRITQADGVGVADGGSAAGGKVREYYIYSEIEGATVTWFGVLRQCVMAQNYLDSCSRNNHAPDRRIVKFLTHGSEDGALNLSDRPLDDDVVKIVAEVILDASTPIKALDLSRSSLSVDQATTIVEAMLQSQHCMISRFNASGNRIGLAPFVPLFAADSARDLILEDCNIDDNDLLFLSRYLHQLRQQQVTSNNSYNLSVAELQKRRQGSDGASAAGVEDSKKDKKKDKKKKADDDDEEEMVYQRPVRTLSACALQQVDMSMNPIGDVGVEALLSALAVGSAHSLVYLGLNSCQCGDQAAQHLCDSLQMFPQLMYIQMRANRIGNEGAVAFSKALLHNKSLTVLDLEGNDPITRSGIMALSHLAQQNNTLQHLSFANHQLNHQGLTAMRLLYRHGLAPPNQV